MKVPTVIRYGFMAIGLVAVSFFTAVGVGAVLFAPKDAAFTSNISSDIAAWIQALGSIGAIIGAFLLGERQAIQAREEANEGRALDEKSKQEAQLAVITLLYRFGKRFDYAREQGLYFLRMDWETTLKNNVRAALHAFDAMPLHDMKSSARVLAASQLRSAVQSMYDVTATNVSDLIAIDDPYSEHAFREISGEIETHIHALEDAWISVTALWPDSPK